jgi:hypothetical protein
MSVELTGPQLRALDADGPATRFIDPRTSAEYRLVPVLAGVSDDDPTPEAVRCIARRNAVGRAADEP